MGAVTGAEVERGVKVVGTAAAVDSWPAAVVAMGAARAEAAAAAAGMVAMAVAVTI